MTGAADDIDVERFLDPRDAAKLMTADQPIAHDGKAGWAVERATGRNVWLAGEVQYDVMARMPGAVRDEPGLTDFSEHGGLPSSPADDEELRAAVETASRKRVQIGLKLSPGQAAELERAAVLFGVTRTTMARLLVVRRATEIVARAGG